MGFTKNACRLSCFLAVFGCLVMTGTAPAAGRADRQLVFSAMCGPYTCIPEMRQEIISSNKALAGLTVERHAQFRAHCLDVVDTPSNHNISIYVSKQTKAIEIECSNVFGRVMARDELGAGVLQKSMSKIAKFNDEQRRRAFDIPWLLEKQGETNDCVYYMGRHLAAALGKNPDLVPRDDLLASRLWGNGFNRWVIEGESTLGFTGWGDVLKIVERGVNDGRLVVLDVTPLPINREIASLNGVKMPEGGDRNHVIRVLGTHLGADGQVDSLHVYDSAGYTPTYTVSIGAVRESYEISARENFRNVFNRGVFVSKERVLPPLR